MLVLGLGPSPSAKESMSMKWPLLTSFFSVLQGQDYLFADLWLPLFEGWKEKLLLKGEMSISFIFSNLFFSCLPLLITSTTWFLVCFFDCFAIAFCANVRRRFEGEKCKMINPD